MNLRQRIAKIATVDDLEKQMELAKTYVKRLRNEAVKAPTLAEKLDINKQLKDAEYTVRQLRFLSFDIEDAIAASESPLGLIA